MTIPYIFDRRIYALRRARARDSFLVEDIGQNLAQRLGAVNRRFASGLDLNTRPQIYAAVEPFAARWTTTSLLRNGHASIVADEEAIPFAPETFDVILSALSLHAVNDLPGTLAQIRRALRPDGLFMAVLFGGDTLSELRDAFAQGESEISNGISPRVAPFADIRELGGLLQRAGFALPVADSEKTNIRYGSFATLVQDLRALGEANALSERTKKFLRRDTLNAVLNAYAARNADTDGRLIATFEVIYLTAWAPHESQPQPLRPGSAGTRLADALQTEEFSAGERATPKPGDT